VHLRIVAIAITPVCVVMYVPYVARFAPCLEPLAVNLNLIFLPDLKTNFQSRLGATL
jgi:hypothetical protein